MWSFQSGSEEATSVKEEEGLTSGTLKSMRVQPQPQATAAKAQPHRNDLVKTGSLASCTAALVALGLGYFSLQAVRARAVIKTRKNICSRRVSVH